MKFIIRRTLLAGLIASAFFSGQATAPQGNASSPTPAWTKMLPQTMRHPCPQEDSVNCYWDAGTAGNHQGHSYIVRQFPRAMTPHGKQKQGTICVMYLKKADAKRWDYCD